MTQISHALAAKMGSRKLSAHPHSAVVSSPELAISQYDTLPGTATRRQTTLFYSVESQYAQGTCPRLSTPLKRRRSYRSWPGAKCYGEGRTGCCSLAHACRVRRHPSCPYGNPLSPFRPLRGRTEKIRTRSDRLAETASAPEPRKTCRGGSFVHLAEEKRMRKYGPLNDTRQENELQVALKSTD